MESSSNEFTIENYIEELLRAVTVCIKLKMVMTSCNKWKQIFKFTWSEISCKNYMYIKEDFYRVLTMVDSHWQLELHFIVA